MTRRRVIALGLAAAIAAPPASPLLASIAQDGAGAKPPAAQASSKPVEDLSQIPEQTGEMGTVVTYERNSWGNAAGDLVQPSEINQLRK